jgi:hypothetical protein
MAEMNDKHDAKNIDIETERVESLIGKSILIGLTYIDSKGSITERKELHGKIIKINNSGISVKLQGIHNGENFRLPPNTKALKEASPGEYRLRTTGEVIINPDLFITYEVNQPA